MENTRQSGGSQQRQRSASMFTNLHSSSYITPIQTQIQQSYDSTFPFSASNSFFEPSSLGVEINPSSISSTPFESLVQPIPHYNSQLPNLSTAEHQHRHHYHYQQQQQQPQQQQFQSQVTAKPYNDFATPFPLNLVNRNKLQEREAFSGKQKDLQEHRLGNVRCYWAIISSRLSDNLTHLPFLHLDPSLEANVESLIGTSMLDFIHPNEANRIEFIILQYIFQEEKRGKMIRCSMKSILLLNQYIRSTTTQNDSKLNSNDFDQLTDIRMECIGDEMIICFFHTVENRSKQVSNQMEKTQWSNVCESSLNTFDERHYQLLWQHILTKRLQEPLTSTIKRHHSGFPITIFQILSNPPNSLILFSWPPPRLFNSKKDHSNSSGTETYNDGSYFADIFARSINDTNLKEENSNLSQFMTACTKRQIKSNTIKTDGLTIDFEAMIIPIGEINFAIFSISRAEYVSQAEEQPIDFRQFEPPLSDQEHVQAYFPQAQQTNQATFPINIPSSHSMTNAGSSFVVPVSQILYNAPSTKMIDNADLSEYGRKASSNVNTLSTNNTFPQVQSTQKQSVMASYESTQENNPSSSSSSSSSFPFYSRQRSFTFSEMPQSTKTCLACGTSKSPEWRKGPDGNKSLCNACGLRFSRNASRLKKKEEKARNAAEVAANGGVIPAHLRKRFQDERDRKRISLQKSSQSTITTSSQQAENQQGISDLTSFVNLSPELQNQLPNLLFASSSGSNSVNTTSTHRIESVSPIQNFIPDSDMDTNEEFI